MFENFIEELKKIDLIKNVNELSKQSYCFVYYLKIFKCDITVHNNDISLIVCIPPNWEQNLVDIYIENYKSLKFIPHVECNGKICLFEREGILIDKNLLGITIQSIYRAEEILKDGSLENNLDDFINEFELYWQKLPNSRIVEFIKPDCEKTQNLKCAFHKVVRMKNEKQKDYIDRKINGIFYATNDVEKLQRWNLKKVTIFNAGYFIINANSYVFPPDIRSRISIEFLNNLLKFIDKNILLKIISKMGKDKILIFQINQINKKTNYLGFFIKGGKFVESGDIYKFENIDDVQPLIIKREDRHYLLSRTSCNDMDYEKKILVIGCGSIGGYLINELVKEGFFNLTIVDDDYLCNENIFRHLLGLEYVSLKKCFALKKYLSNNIPDIQITAIDEKIEDILMDNEIDLNKFDVIFSSTGNHNMNRWLNKYINENRIETPIVYLWNEVYGIGNHVAYFKYGYPGCYDCLFSKNEENGELYDRSSYCQAGQKIAQNVYGCDKSFVPYGNTVSLKTVIMCMDIVRKIFNNDIHENFILSMKGNDIYFKKQGLKVSKRYKNQKEFYQKITGEQLMKENCEVCNGNK